MRVAQLDSGITEAALSDMLGDWTDIPKVRSYFVPIQTTRSHTLQFSTNIPQEFGTNIPQETSFSTTSPSPRPDQSTDSAADPRTRAQAGTQADARVDTRPNVSSRTEEPDDKWIAPLVPTTKQPKRSKTKARFQRPLCSICQNEVTEEQDSISVCKLVDLN